MSATDKLIEASLLDRCTSSNGHETAKDIETDVISRLDPQALAEAKKVFRAFAASWEGSIAVAIRTYLDAATADTISSLKEENRLLSVENGLLLSNAAAKGEEPDLLLAEWHNERRRADRAEEAFAICVAQIGALREALEPFAAFAENVDEEGWMFDIHRGSISTWFGPSDFRRAARALSDSGETEK